MTNGSDLYIPLSKLNVISQIENHSHICKIILYKDLPDTRIRIWDLMIFIPNSVFFLFLLWQSRKSRERIKQLKNFPILRNFYIFINLCVIISMSRCVISSLIKIETFSGETASKIYWVFVRFFLLSTEISVLVFGLLAGRLDVRQSIRRILSITLALSLIYSICQGLFEILSPDTLFYIQSKSYHLFGHGGMVFWSFTCFLSFFIYLNVVLLPWLPCRTRLLLPTKRSFYYYAAILSLLNLIQAMGALMFYLKIPDGLCIVDVTTYLYFTMFTPLVYFVFLSPFLAAGSSSSAAAALVTTTVGAESSATHSVAPLNRSTNLFNAGIRGAVNFSYRPQIDDELIDNEDDFASSIGSFNGGGLHFDHYGPYAYNSQRQVFTENQKSLLNKRNTDSKEESNVELTTKDLLLQPESSNNDDLETLETVQPTTID
ncbi:Transmembrane protein adipocyte-associated 1 [Sarcoptes scabiei]|nr:Transmembrane protein adipocyte-associated 1 [Sarcoptes scabiei]